MPLFRRIEDRYGVDDPGYVPPVGRGEATPLKPSVPRAPAPPKWRRIARVVVFVLLIAQCWAYYTQRETTHATVVEITLGVLATLVLMAAIGGTNSLVRRARYAPRSWWDSTFTVPVMLITLVIGTLVYIARQ